MLAGLIFAVCLAAVSQAQAQTATKLFSEVDVTPSGQHFIRATYSVTGLSGGANTIPFPAILPRPVRRVFLQAVGNNAVGVIVSLDTSRGVVSTLFVGGRLGWDQTNVYMYIGAGTQCLMTVDY